MLKPTNEWILTKPIKQEEKITDSGILLVTKEEETIKYVEILSFGPEANKHSLLKAGDIVMVPTHTGLKTEHEDTEYEFAKEKNFLCVMEDIKETQGKD